MVFLVATAGVGLMALGAVLAAVGSGSGADSFAPYVSGGGAATAVAGIVYIARLMATGRLVARDTAAEAIALKAALDKMTATANEAHDREKAYINLLTKKASRSTRSST